MCMFLGHLLVEPVTLGLGHMGLSPTPTVEITLRKVRKDVYVYAYFKPYSELFKWLGNLKI